MKKKREREEQEEKKKNTEDLQWNAAAEAELRSIEDSYYLSKRQRLLTTPTSRYPEANRRILPPWGYTSPLPVGAPWITPQVVRHVPPGTTWSFHPTMEPISVPGATWHLHPPLPVPIFVEPETVPPPPQAGHNVKASGNKWKLTPPCKVKYPVMNFGGRTVYCRTATEVNQATEELLDKFNKMKQEMDFIPLGFDIEWKPVFQKGEAQRKAAVMQICIDNATCYVIHIFHSGIPLNLKSFMEDKSSTKVGICIADDARKMLQDYDVRVEPLEDLSDFANRKLGDPRRTWGLASLTEKLTGKQLLKPGKIRMGNWETKVLSSKQIQYAATDAYVSWHLHEILSRMPDPKADEHKGIQTSDKDNKEYAVSFRTPA